jgi:hypothetical protein
MKSISLRSLTAAIVFAAAAVPACAATSSSSSAATDAAAYADSVCNYLARCAVDSLAQSGEPPEVVAGYVLGEMSDKHLRACSDSARAAFADEYRYIAGLPDAPAPDWAAMVAVLATTACWVEPAFVFSPGARVAGKSCLDDLQCASTSCNGQSGACGVCVDRAVPSAVGAPCMARQGMAEVPCVNGASCQNNLCVADAAPKKAGDACAGVFDPCDLQALIMCTANVCTDMRANLGDSCATKYCVGSACSSDSKTCVAFKTSGACKSSIECDVFHGFACADATKTCTRFTGAEVRAKVGEGCGPQADGTRTRCAPSLACDDTTKKCVDALSTCKAP